MLKNYGYNYFYIARYVISCCAVDSVPMKILVEKTFFNDYPDGTWLTVKGKLSQKVVKVWRGRLTYNEIGRAHV